MTLEQSATIMDAIFVSTEIEGRARLLKIMQDFLLSESAKHSAKEKGALSESQTLNHTYTLPAESVKGKSNKPSVDMEELVGNTDGFADSGYKLTLAFYN